MLPKVPKANPEKFQFEIFDKKTNQAQKLFVVPLHLINLIKWNY